MGSETRWERDRNEVRIEGADKSAVGKWRASDEREGRPEAVDGVGWGESGANGGWDGYERGPKGTERVKKLPGTGVLVTLHVFHPARVNREVGTGQPRKPQGDEGWPVPSAYGTVSVTLSSRHSVPVPVHAVGEAEGR